MKKKLTKILAGMLVVVIVLTSLTVDWGNVIEAEAAEEINQNLLAGDVLCDVDFTEEYVNLMDDRFVVSEATKVKDSWEIGKLTNTATTNAAQGGSVTMELNAYLTTRGYTANNLVDSNTSSWMSTEDSGRTDPYQDQIIEISLAGNAFYTIDKVSFYPRDGKYGIPEDFTIDVYNGEEWITVAKETGYKSQNWWSKVITPIVGNKVRLHATKLGATDSGTKYAIQLGEIMVFGEAISNVAAAGTAEMEIMPYLANNIGHTADIIKNGNTSDYTSTDYSTTQTTEKTATIVFDRQIYHTVNQVKLYPRSNGAGFPEEFVIDAKCGNEEDDWTPIQTLTGCTAQTMTIDIQPTLCSAIRIRATKLGAADGQYALMLAEIEVYGTPLTNAALNGTVSMNVPDASWTEKYQATQLTDGENAKNSSEIDTTDSNNDEFATTAYNKVSATAAQEVIEIAFPNSKYYSIQEIKLYPRLKNGARFGGFPEEFTIKFWDGRDWIPYDGIDITGCTGNTEDSTEPWGLLVEETVCNKIKIEVTKMGLVENKTDQWAVQLAEVEAYGEPVDFLTTKEAYNSESPVTSVLSLKDVTVENFKAEIEMLNFDNTATQYGVYFGHDAYDSTDDAVYPAINLPTTTAGDFNTLNIEVVSGEMKLWWNGFEDNVQTTSLPETYDGGYFTLFSTGNDQGGFKSLKIQEYLVRQGADADLTCAELETLNETFVSSRGTTGEDGTVVESVAEHWSLEYKSVERINVAHEKGTPSIDDEASYAPASRLNDGVTNSNITSTTAYSQEVIEDGVNATINFDGDYKIDQIKIYWRAAAGAPKTFEVQVLIGQIWKSVAAYGVDEDYTTTSNILDLEIEPRVCKGVRVHATKLGMYESKYWLQFYEIEAYGVPTTNAAIGGTAEMEVMNGMSASLPVTNLNDGTHNSTWTSTNYADEEDTKKTAIVTLNGGNYYSIDHVRLFPRNSTNDVGFPKGFKVSAWDGKQWVMVTEEPIVNCDISKTGYYWSQEITPITCNAIKIETTQLGMADDKYVLQLSEIEAWGQPVDLLTTNTANTESYTSMLTWKGMKVKNFKAEIELLDFDTSETSYGLYFGQSDYGVVEEGVISVTPRSAQAGGIVIGGTAGVDATSASSVSVSGSNAFNPNVVGNNVRSNFVISGFVRGTYDISHILNVEVIDGIIKVWWTGHENEAWTVEMLPEYYETYKNEGGYVSVYSTGNDLGGIKSMKMQEIIDEEMEMNVDMYVETYGDYTIVSVNNDIGAGIHKNSVLKGQLHFDSERFEYCTTVVEDAKVGILGNTQYTPSNESVTIDMSSYTQEAVAKYYFKNLAGENDYTGFSVEVDSVTRTTGQTALAEETERVAYDYTGVNRIPDKCIDTRDLVRSVADDNAPEEVRKALLGLGDDWVEAVAGEVSEEVYVDAANGSQDGTGEETSPFNSLTLAAYRVAKEGTIHVVGTYTFDATEKEIGIDDKTITITGGTLDLTNLSSLGLRGNVILDDITLAAVDYKTIYANGHTLHVKQSAIIAGTVAKVFGGNGGAMPLDSTELILETGHYDMIYGGSNGVSMIKGSTNVTIAGDVNSELDLTEVGSVTSNCVYGGSIEGIIKNESIVTVKDSARVGLVFGGGYHNATYTALESRVDGTCKVNINGGNVMGYYGGSYAGVNYKTEIVMTKGQTDQIFGGNWGSSMSAEGSSTSITLNGGTVTRRMYGGCYNGVNTDVWSATWTEENYVNGTTKIIINADVFEPGSDTDTAICAGSRLDSECEHNDDENTELYFATNDLYESVKNYLGSNMSFTNSIDACDTLYIDGVAQE